MDAHHTCVCFFCCISPIPELHSSDNSYYSPNPFAHGFKRYADLKLKFYRILIAVGIYENKYLDVCKYSHSVFNTATIQADKAEYVNQMKTHLPHRHSVKLREMILMLMGCHSIVHPVTWGFSLCRVGSLLQ